MKVCSKCKEVKQLDNFYPHKDRKDGLSCHCKECHLIYSKRYRSDYSEKEKAYAKAKVKSIEPGVYLVKCLVNNRIYVGQSTSPYSRRCNHFSIRSEGKQLNTNPALQEDLKTYGKNAFVFEIIEHCPEEDLLAREDYYIRSLRPYYNNATV